jgi:serine-type D-Ala-D-Ala carboxypeptidase/endopeptidase
MRLRIAAFLGLVALPAPALAAQPFPADSTILRMVERRAASGRNPGVVVGILDERGPRYFSAGTSGRDGLPLDERTAFEIGSITKVFTGLALAAMATSGVVSLDDPVARHLPAGVAVPAQGGAEITLRHLSTHTSGLPRLPSNLFPASMADPYAEYGHERLYDFLAGHALAHTPGEHAEYSNVGAGLLGHALAHRAGSTYGEMVSAVILRPLALSDTWVEPAADREARTAVGHNALGRPVPYWRLGALEGAGALRSTAMDLLRFAAANLDPEGSAMAAALRLAREVHGDGDSPGRRMGLGWVLQEHPRGTWLWHNGGTGGFRSFLALDPSGGRAVVVLTNGSAPLDDLGLHLLDPVAFPLPPG